MHFVMSGLSLAYYNGQVEPGFLLHFFLCLISSRLEIVIIKMVMGRNQKRAKDCSKLVSSFVCRRRRRRRRRRHRPCRHRCICCILLDKQIVLQHQDTKDFSRSLALFESQNLLFTLTDVGTLRSNWCTYY